MRRVVCIDFDGTVVDHEYPTIGKLKAGVKEAFDWFRANDWYIIVSSCRSCYWNAGGLYNDLAIVPTHDRTVHKDMVKCLDENDLPYDEIDVGDKGKVSADLYVDDKGFRFENDWSAVTAFAGRL